MDYLEKVLSRYSDIEIGFKVGVSVATVSRWRKGKHKPQSQAMRDRIANLALFGEPET